MDIQALESLADERLIDRKAEEVVRASRPFPPLASDVGMRFSRLLRDEPGDATAYVTVVVEYCEEGGTGAAIWRVTAKRGLEAQTVIDASLTTAVGAAVLAVTQASAVKPIPPRGDGS